MIRQLPNGTCVNVESIEDLEDVLSDEQLKMVKLLIDGKDEYIEELEDKVDELEEEIYSLEEDIELLEEDIELLEEEVK